MLHDFSVFLSTGFNDLCHYLQLLFVKSEFLVVHLAGTKEHSTLFFVSLFYFLNYFLILIFSIMLVTFSPIPIWGNLQIHKISFFLNPAPLSCLGNTGAMKQPRTCGPQWEPCHSAALQSILQTYDISVGKSSGCGTVCPVPSYQQSPLRRKASFHPPCKHLRKTRLNNISQVLGEQNSRFNALSPLGLAQCPWIHGIHPITKPLVICNEVPKGTCQNGATGKAKAWGHCLIVPV